MDLYIRDVDEYTKDLKQGNKFTPEWSFRMGVSGSSNVVAGLSPRRKLVKTWHRPLRWAGQSPLPIKSLKPYPPNISPGTNSYIFS